MLSEFYMGTVPRSRRRPHGNNGSQLRRLNPDLGNCMLLHPTYNFTYTSQPQPALNYYKSISLTSHCIFTSQIDNLHS